MRVMIDTECPNCRLEVEQVHVLTNGWEYFLERPNRNGVAFGLVCGWADEMGDVYLSEIQPYILSSANAELSDALPATGWRWEDEATDI